MPNWCIGCVEVKGKVKDVKEFCKLFVFEGDFDEKGEGDKKKFFARSFTNRKWVNFEKEHFKNMGEKDKIEIDFPINFAWSCHSCIIDGYPTRETKFADTKGKCVTLKWACKKYKVDVHITTEEESCSFEEDVTCDSKGNLKELCKEMPVHICQNCGNKQPIPSSYSSSELEDVECSNCSHYGEWDDELKALLKKKIENKNG